MVPILLAVEHVIDEIHHAGQHAEHEERDRRAQNRCAVAQALGKDERAEDKQVLRPLSGTERANEVQRERLRR
jgi:hypothetical protein